MDNYFDFDQAAIPPFDLSEDISSTCGETNQLESNELFDSLFLDKSASLPAQRSDEPDTVMLKLINDREVEAVRWADDPEARYPMFKAKTPCSLCKRMNMDCYLASRGTLITGCTACISLFRECSFTHTEWPQGFVATFAGIAEDEQVCHGPTVHKKAANHSYSNADTRGRKSGSRFHRDAVKILKKWLSEHAEHPYPNERERDELKQLTGLKRSQINNWLANARRRGKVQPASGPASPMVGAVDIPIQEKSYEDLGPLDRWKCSPPEHEPALMTDIARAVVGTEIPSSHPASRNHSSTPIHNSRASSRKASSEDDSNISVMFQPPSESSFETRESSNSSFSHASSRSHRSRQSFASSQNLRRRRRNPLLHQRTNSTGKMGPPPPMHPRMSQSKPVKGGKERIFQCTFCTEAFPSKYDWQRHEKSLHLALERWTCSPMGPTRIDPTTGLHQCVFCPKLSPTAAHMEEHNFPACNEKTLSERTFYRKDHLRQHLRLMHDVKLMSHMDTWKSTTFQFNSCCGFCPSLFSTWQARADHLAAHFKNGSDMKDWSGGWGFDSFVQRVVENAIPPYLIGYERGSMNPYRAREVPKSSSYQTTSPSNTNPTEGARSATVSSARGEDSGAEISCIDKIELDQVSKDTNCWHRLEEELIKFVLDQKSKGTIPEDKTIQDHARIVVYGDPDPWDWTMADNPTWLDAFKVEHGLVVDPNECSPHYQSTRVVPVAAPYVVKGGLKITKKKIPSLADFGRPSSQSSPLGAQERNCALADYRSCPQTNLSVSSSYHGGTPITPVENMFDYQGPQGIIDGQAMNLDFDAIDFTQLDLSTFDDMNFEDEVGNSQAGSLPATSMMNLETAQNIFAPAQRGGGGVFADMGMGIGVGMQNGIAAQKPLPAPTQVNPFTSNEDDEGMSLEAFDQLTGYMNGFR